MFENLKRSQRRSSGGRGGVVALLFGVVSSPRVRLAILCAAVVVLGVIYALAKGYSKTPSSSGVRDDDLATPLRKKGTFTPIDIGDLPALSRSIAAKVKDDTAAERRVVNGEVLDYLLNEVESTPAVFHYTKNLFPLERYAPAIEDKPDNWRFKFFRWRGELEGPIKDLRYAEVFAGKLEGVIFVYRGRVRVGEGDDAVRVVFITPLAPRWADKHINLQKIPLQDIVDGWVRGYGIFVKRFLDKNPDGSETPAFLFVATRIDRDYETRDVASLADVGFDGIRDNPSLAGTELESLLFRLYPLPMFRLLKYAEARSGPEGAALREKEKLVPRTLGTLKAYEDLIQHPEKHRADYLGGLGAIARTPHIQEVEPPFANDAGIEQWATGWIIMDSPRKLFQYMAPAHLVREWPKLTRIRYEGFFYKTQAYYRRGADSLTPLLVLTVLEEVRPAERDYSGQIIFATGFTLVIGLMVWLILREDLTKRNYKEMRRKRRIIPAK